MPGGFPESVSSDYLSYQFWDTVQVSIVPLSRPFGELFSVQAFCSSITGTLATLAILKGVGVGDSSATPLAATVTWMLKGETTFSVLHLLV